MAKKKQRLVHDEVTPKLLKLRTDIMANAGYPKPKYVEFCEALLQIGYRLTLYEAKETVSKYITVYGAGDTKFKVRFSNHPPSHYQENNRDCDFIVGQVRKGKWQSMPSALAAVKEYFNAL